jgi:putative copper resistance protein D
VLALAADPGTAVLAHGDGLPGFGAWSVVTQARPELLPVLLVLVLGGLYLFGVSRLRARGDRWSTGRTLSFVGGGLGTVAVATMSTWSSTCC